MDIATLCAIVASLRVLPNRTQFFQYESVSLSCELQGNSSDWRVRRNTSTNINEECIHSRNGSSCLFTDLYPSDSGVYWCESGNGECSNAVSITVTAGSVILQSPALPVMEGEAVTLHCTSKETSSSNLNTDFYKDGLLIQSSSTGNLTIHSVSKSDEGLYNCSVPGAGESPDIKLTVRGHHEQLKRCPLTHILLPVVGICLLMISALLLCLWKNRKESARQASDDLTLLNKGSSSTQVDGK